MSADDTQNSPEHRNFVEGFTIVIKKGISAGDAQNPEFRKQVYTKAYATVMELENSKKLSPEQRDVRLAALKTSIAEIEDSFIIGNMVMGKEKSAPQFPPSPKTVMPSKPHSPLSILPAKPGKKQALLVISVICIIAVIVYSYGWQQTRQLTTQLDSHVEISVGKSVTSGGSAELLPSDDVLLMMDNAADDVQFYQWVISQVPAGASQRIRIEVDSRPNFEAFKQIQIVYSAPDTATRSYVYVINLETGLVVPKSHPPLEEFHLIKGNKGWVFDVTTENIDAESNMQLMLHPVVGRSKTGIAVIHSISIK